MLAQEFHDEVWWPICLEKLREVTQESYRCSWKNHIGPALGKMELKDITPRFLDKWLKEKQITASVWRVTKAFIRTAYKYEEIDRDPCDRVLNAPPRKRPNPPTLSYWEMQQLMDGLKDTPIYTTICCSCFCGLRREESCALEWSDFEWNLRGDSLSYVNITKGVQYIHGREITVDPKTNLSRRRLPLPTDLVRRLYNYKKSDGRLLGDLHVHQAASRYRRFTKERDLPYVPMSNLRTSWATYMINTGAPVSLISRYMGHADVETTVRWYTKPSERDLDTLTKMWSTPEMDKPKESHWKTKPDISIDPMIVSMQSSIPNPMTIANVTNTGSTRDDSRKEKEEIMNSLKNLLGL